MEKLQEGVCGAGAGRSQAGIKSAPLANRGVPLTTKGERLTPLIRFLFQLDGAQPKLIFPGVEVGRSVFERDLQLIEVCLP